MKDDMEWYINGKKVDNHKIKFDSIPYISIVIKGSFKKESNYAILHNDVVHNISTIGEDTLNVVIDTKNQVGYHLLNLLVNDEPAFFIPIEVITEGADNILLDFWAIVDQLFSSIVTTQGVFTYVDKLGKTHTIRNAYFSYNWVNSRFTHIEKNIVMLNQNMPRNLKHTYRKSPQIKKMNTPRTIKLLRKDPSLLAKNSHGIGIHGGHYVPEMVVIEQSQPDFKRVENIQLFDMLRGLHQNVQSLIELFLSKNENGAFDKELASCLTWLKKISYLRSMTFLSNLDAKDLAALQRFPKTPLQVSNLYYRNLYHIYLEFINNNLDVSDKARDKVYSHIGNIDKIYQTYFATLLADSYKMNSYGDSLEETSDDDYSYGNENVKLYYKSSSEHLPKPWTKLASVPDFILHLEEKDEHAIILCKYSEEDGKVPSNIQMEVSAYMNSYGIDTAFIVYPGDYFGILECNSEDEKCQKILQIPLKPHTIKGDITELMKIYCEFINLAIDTKTPTDLVTFWAKVKELDEKHKKFVFDE